MRLFKKKLLKSQLSEKEWENLKDIIMSIERKKIIYFATPVMLFSAVLEALPFLFEYITGKDKAKDFEIALWNYIETTLVLLLVTLARQYPYVFKKIHFNEDITKSVRNFLKKGFYAATLVIFIGFLFGAVKAYVDTGVVEYIFPYIIGFIFCFLIEYFVYFCRLWAYDYVLFKKTKPSVA
ncbi:hypothetical protein M1N78_03120 [Peptococcaceae bacterium]|nr:hypothetical protein [Peptococcaceae bacterium]